jgi:hypothetical protein
MTSQTARPLSVGGENPDTAALAVARDLGAWVIQFARTLKTCRLYDSNNPTVVRFREDLNRGLSALFDQYGQLSLDVTSRELSCGGVSVYSAHSRDDNLAGTLHRDGVRRISFLPTIGPGELDLFVDQILHVTGPACGDDDLVSLMWEANLPGIAIMAIPVEGDVEGGGGEDGDAASPLPWPTSAGEDPGPGLAVPSGAKTGSGDSARSDDWDVLEKFSNLDEAYDELESSAIHEVARLQQACQTELALPVVTRAIEALTLSLATETTAGDRDELAHFIPRVLREAIITGDWEGARSALAMLRSCDPEWSLVVFFEGMTGGASAALTRQAVAALDGKSDAGIEEFLVLAREFGEASAEWLMLVLAESQQSALGGAHASHCRDPEETILSVSCRGWVRRAPVRRPERRSHPGWIGGDAVAAHLKAAIHHPEIRVRREIVAALASTSPAASRPILMGMLSTAEPPLFTTLLHQLSLSDDPLVAQRLVEMLRDDRFHDRSEEEKRAVYMALSNQGDHVLPTLEEEMQRGGLFAHGLDLHRQSVARCMARIGTPVARKRSPDRCAQSSKIGGWQSVPDGHRVA